MRTGSDEPARVRIPSRLDFAGGWSDVRYFSEREGGAVLNAAINHCVEGSALAPSARRPVARAVAAACCLSAPRASDTGWRMPCASTAELCCLSNSRRQFSQGATSASMGGRVG